MGCFCKKVRTLHCKVVLLDEQELVQEIQENSPGHEVLDTVFRHLNLLETAYFGLRYLDTANQPHWLDPTKKVARELKGTISCTLYFGVKFYAADPCKLLEEITRYQFYLQVKQDILQGRLPVTFDLAAELGAYVVQSELGDYDPRRHSPGYVSEFRFVSNQTDELEDRIAEIHKGLVGQLPADAELAYLDRVKWLDMYGVDLHPVLGEDNVEYFLGLTPSGIIVLRNKNKVGNYYWPRITKIYFKGRYFMLRVCDKNNEENTYGFETPSRAACKQLWKCCVEHHAFFRLVRVSPAPNDIFRLGSRFRYSGRTEKQARGDVEAGRRAPPTFERSPSRRQQRRVVEGATAALSKWQGPHGPQGRRVVEGAAHTPNMDEIENRENISPPDKGLAVSSPTAANTAPSVRHPSPPLSTRSTRSAPWTEPHARGLYNSASSPRSLRSAASTGRIVANNNKKSHGGHGAHRRSSSVESHSSNDSRPCRRHRRHRSRKGSDSESEVSKCSERCHSRCRHRKHRHKSRHRSGNNSGSRVELVDSTGQWKEVQRRQAEGSLATQASQGGGGRVQQAMVVSSNSRRSGYANSGADTETAETHHGRHRRRLRTKHRSRSRSPSESKRLPDELKQHLDFSLVDTEGMSEAQLREIPYTVVQTAAKPVKVKMSPNNRRRAHRSSRRSLKSHEDGGSTDRLSVNSQPVSRSALSIPPLPFSPSASSLYRPHQSLTAVEKDRASPAGLAVNGHGTPPSSAPHGPPLPRFPSAAQLNGNSNNVNNNNNNNNINNKDQSQTQIPKYLKAYQAVSTPQQPQLPAYGVQSSSSSSSRSKVSSFVSPHASSDRLDSDGQGVTSFGTNGTRTRAANQLANQHQPPSNSPHRGWAEVASGGGAACAASSSGRGSSASSSSPAPHHLLFYNHRGSTGSSGGSRRGSASSSPSPLPPIVTPHGVTFQHPVNAPTRGRTTNGATTRSRAGPLYFQQQLQQQQQQLQQQQQQIHNAALRNAILSDNGGVQAVKMAARVQNAAYMQYSDPMLNGNDPTYRSAPNAAPKQEGQRNAETCTEL